MPSRQYPLLGLATTLLVALTGQSSVAFTINYPPPERSNPYIRYDEEGYSGEAYLVVPESIQRGGTDELLQLLNDFSTRNPGRWEFQRAQNDLHGRFDLQSYYICGPRTDCGKEIGPPYNEGVGSFLDLQYYPVLLSGDPIPDPTGITRRVQWIQRVYTNHSLNPDKHGLIENVLDINIGQTTPYYSGVAGNELGGIPPTPYRFFADAPYRVDPVENHTWDAELYLAEETQVPGSQKKIVTIYNGIKWGWRNVSRRKPVSGGGGGCSGGSGGGGCSTTASANAVAGRELPLSDIDSGEASQSPKSVPEPTSVLGVLALGVWGVVQGLKKRIAKQP